MSEISDTEQVLIFFLFSLSIGIAIWRSYKFIPIHVWKPPFTVVLFLIGIGVSAWADKQDLGKFGHTLRNAQNVDPHVILFVLLPPLIFESAYGMDFHVFSKVSSQSLWLAGPGVIVSTVIISSVIHSIFDYSWNWSTSLLLASILAATDPVAVVATLNSLGAPLKLSSLIEGEALLNDGSAFVLFSVFLDLAAGGNKSGQDIVSEFCQLALGAVAWGYGAGLVTSFCLNIMLDDPIGEISVALTAMIATFALAEIEFEVSGVLSVVVFGLYLSHHGQWAFSPEVVDGFKGILEQLSFFSTVVIFVLSGVVGYEKMFSSQPDVASDSRNWAYLILLFVFLNVLRLLFVFASFPLLSRSGYGMNWKEAILLSWSGLRGAVGLSLGLLVELEENIPRETRDLVNFYVNGVVILSLIVNGTWTKSFYEWLDIYEPNPYRDIIFHKAIEEIEDKQVPSFIQRLKEDWLYSHAHWEAVSSLIPDFHNLTLDHGTVSQKQVSFFGVTSVFRNYFVSSDCRSTSQPAVHPNSHINHKLAKLHQNSYFPDINMKGKYGPLQRSCSVDPIEDDMKKEEEEEFQFSSLATKAIGVYREMPESDFTEEDRCEQIVESIFRYLRAEYHHQFDTRQLGSKAIIVLLEAADKGSEAQVGYQNGERVKYCLQSEWNSLQKFIESYIQPILLKKRNYEILNILTHTVAFGRMLHVVEMYSSFIRAHHDLVELFQEAVPDPDTFQYLHTLLHEARESLKTIARQYPRVFIIAQTTYTARYLLKLKIGAVRTALSHGLLEKSEAKSLIDILDSRLASLQVSLYSISLAKLCFRDCTNGSSIELFSVQAQ